MRRITFGCSAKRVARSLVTAAGVSVALGLPAAPAYATCTPNAIGIAHSQGTASEAATTACAPAYGEPADAGSGRKVG